MIDHKKPEPKAVRALILAPTRELVNQIATNLRIFTRKSPIKIAIVVGGASINKQMQEVGRGVDILVATPGRLLDLVNRRAMTLTATRFLVLDEADQMLDLGFIMTSEAHRQAGAAAPPDHAVFGHHAKGDCRSRRRISAEPETGSKSRLPARLPIKLSNIVHFVTGKDQKAELLRKSLSDNPDGLALVFMRTKHSS